MRIFISGPDLAKRIEETNGACLFDDDYQHLKGSWLHPDGCVMKNLATNQVYSIAPKDSNKATVLIGDIFEYLELLCSEDFKEFNNFTHIP